MMDPPLSAKLIAYAVTDVPRPEDAASTDQQYQVHLHRKDRTRQYCSIKLIWHTFQERIVQNVILVHCEIVSA